MSSCNHDCSSCKDSGCKERKDFTAKLKEGCSFKKTIAVMSGKGGVGKSLITSLLAVESSKRGLKTAVLDADVTGPSIPKVFGLGDKRAQGSDEGLYPVVTDGGIKVMSINLLLEEPSMPVVWRGPVISGVVKQFYTDVLWGENDLLFIDMPPGTGDVPLTVFQSLNVDGIIVVTTPQDLVSMIVEKSVKMANMMGVKIFGIIENMSYAVCPNCDEKFYLFGESKTKEIAKEYGLKVLAEIPLNPTTAKTVDEGKIETLQTDMVCNAINKILES